jgi:hypothetical protein
MTQRIAITVAGLVATIILAFGLVAAGFGPQSAPSPATKAADAIVDPAIQASTSVDAGPEVETVYVRPAPPPRTVVVRRQPATSSRSSSSTLRQYREVRYDRDDEDRSEGNDREDRDEHEDHEDHEDDD